jgi:hypothetical protein
MKTPGNIPGLGDRLQLHARLTHESVRPAHLQRRYRMHNTVEAAHMMRLRPGAVKGSVRVESCVTVTVTVVVPKHYTSQTRER